MAKKQAKKAEGPTPKQRTAIADHALGTLNALEGVSFAHLASDQRVIGDLGNSWGQGAYSGALVTEGDNPHLETLIGHVYRDNAKDHNGQGSVVESEVRQRAYAEVQNAIRLVRSKDLLTRMGITDIGDVPEFAEDEKEGKLVRTYQAWALRNYAAMYSEAERDQIKAEAKRAYGPKKADEKPSSDAE